MESTHPLVEGLVSVRELRPAGVPRSDVAAFALESDWRSGDHFSDRVYLYCPPCVQMQFDLNAEPLGAACSTCGHMFRPGVAAAMRDAFTVLTALERFEPEELIHVVRGSAGLINHARRMCNPVNDNPVQANHRRAWAYSKRGQRLLAATEEELRENADLYASRHAG